MLDEPLQVLVGEELNAVSFVLDYVEFHFNGPVLRALTPPSVHTSDGVSTFSAPGSRDALCSLIGKTVTQLTVSERAIELSFGATYSLSVGLGGHRANGESVHFMTGKGQNVLVW